MVNFSDFDLQQDTILDSTVMRVHACAAGYEKDGNNVQAFGISKGSFSARIHYAVDNLGDSYSVGCRK
ncbi:hypothetical protein [Facilibium subflavum]|uniref:hypothetical protein n=1 Tax=Facilibium subflavum TaxID=2219058 RepID=UPI000E65CB46|nr:hypothetical protein [Facilibium subflavum]